MCVCDHEALAPMTDICISSLGLKDTKPIKNNKPVNTVKGCIPNCLQSQARDLLPGLRSVRTIVD